jgi:hypothetical protein
MTQHVVEKLRNLIFMFFIVVYKVNADFKEDVQKLPNSLDNKQPFLAFVEKYGTHFTSKIVMGAKAVVQHVVK